MRVSNANELSGRLEEFRLVELLQMVGMGARGPMTGALHLYQDNDRTGVLYFEGGALVSCTELDTEALTLGHVMQQLNLATAAQLDQAFQQQTQDPLGKRIGERLIDLRIVTPDQLNHALKTQTLWTARELGLWREGAYEFHTDERLSAGTSSQQIEPTRAVMELLRYEHEWESLAPFLPEGMRTHVALAFEPPAGHPLLFHATAWRVISRVNSQRTIRRIATSLHLPELDVARMIGPLVQEGLLVPVGAAGGPGLPVESIVLGLDNFDLFTLLIGMEQDWLKCKTPLDQLVALAGFINLTMRSLEDVCRANGLGFPPDTLQAILNRERLVGVGQYQLRIENNHVNVEHFAAYCRQALGGTMGAAKAFYDEWFNLLIDALAAAFESINGRVASPLERSQNQEAWEALFLTFRDDGTSEH